MSTIQILQISFEFWSAVFCLITAICVLATMRYDKAEAKSLLGLLFTNTALNIAEALAYYYRGNLSDFGIFVTRASNFTVFLCNHLLLFFVIAFLCRIIKRNGGKDFVRERKTANIITALGIALLIASRFFGFYYTFDENNLYHRLPSYWLMLAIIESVILITIIITFRSFKALSTAEKVAFLMFEFLPLIATVFQSFIYGISITTMAGTISILTIFVTYELEYAGLMVEREKRLFNQVISAFAHTIDAKDRYTGGHSERVAKYSRMLAERMGLSRRKTEEIYQAALLHDIGKIGISGSLLRKSGGLSEEEFDTIRSHPVKGGEILEEITELPTLAIGARWHHEHFDGTGYPDGIKGLDIPIEARIISVADSYDAMASNRSYRNYLPQEKVRSEIEKNIGTQFDPDVAKCMLEIIDEDKNYELHE